LGVIFSGIDCLLGMDIINTGDFIVTCLNGNTCMTFRHPSSHEVDFYKNPTYGIADSSHLIPHQSLNSLCSCGSGLKYKRCHGKTN